MLSHHYKLTVVMIDQQMKELQNRKASDEHILKVLSDFVPDVKGVFANAGKKELKACLKTYARFASFAEIVQGKPLREKKTNRRT